jgi:hypothetical protein
MTHTVSAMNFSDRVQQCVFVLVAVAAALVPLESFLITLLARTAFVPDKVLFGLGFAIEGSLYAALFAVVLARLIGGYGIRRTPADAPLLIIFAIVALAVAVNDAPIKGSLFNLRSALRFAAVFYMVTQAGLTRKQVSAVLWVILVSGAVQVFTGLLQWQAGSQLMGWMMPYTPDIEVAGQARRFTIVERGREIGSLFGTLGDTLYYGLFLLVVLAVALSHNLRWRSWDGFNFAALIVATAYAYSRAAVIVTGLTLFAFVGGRLGVRRVTGVCCLLAASGVVVIAAAMIMQTTGDAYRNPRQGRRSILTNMTNIFSAEYLERSKRQRLGTVLGVAPTALMNAPVLGYGADQEHAIQQLNEAQKTRLYKTLTKEGFEDVYWVALLCYTGIAGVLAVFWLVVRLMWTCVAVVRGARGDPVVRWAGLAGLCVVGQAAVLMWFNRVPEIRAFSFYLWLLPALAYAAWSAQQTEALESSDATTPGPEMP